MVYNNIVNAVRRYCMENSSFYQTQYAKKNYTGIVFYKYRVLDDLLYWVETIVDSEFNSAEECKQTILSFAERLRIKKLADLPNALAHKYVVDESRHFVEFTISLDQTCQMIDLPYNRVIIGVERERIGREHERKWDFYRRCYWVPLSPSDHIETLWLMTKFVKKCYSEIVGKVLAISPHVYKYGEGSVEDCYCAETDDVSLDFTGREIAYVDKDFSWLIYLSHEETITFAGSILPMMREMLANEREHWDKTEF